MIIDNINNLNRYKLPEKGFQFLIDYISKYSEQDFEKRKHPIREPVLYRIGIEYDTKNANEGLWEAHRTYIDVHWILEGEEKVEINNIANMTISKPYESEGDYELFNGEKHAEFILKAGDFMILYPEDVHKTGVKINESSQIKKIVFKILI